MVLFRSCKLVRVVVTRSTLIVVSILLGLFIIYVFTSILVQRNYNEDVLKGSGDLVKQVPIREYYVALTFDDGPDKDYTPQVLDVLERENVKATFFVIGSQVDQFPDIVKVIAESGHEVANHSYTHCYTTSPVRLRKEITKTDGAIFKILGVHPKLYRPPGAVYNLATVQTASDLGYRVVLWSKDTRDWQRPGVSAIVRRALSEIAPGDIIVFHDGGGNRSQTIAALPIILQELKKRGIKCVTVSELIDNATRAIMSRD